MSLSWDEAIEKVLEEEQKALHYRDITALILEKGYYKTTGATPEASVSSYLTGDIKKYARVDRSVYILRKFLDNQIEKSQIPLTNNNEVIISGNDAYESIIHSYGMFWDREKALWKSNPDIFGVFQLGATPINFNKQIGIYLLYDGREIVYVGQAIKQPIGERLYQHTIDRLSGRWDRFSWFGLYSVKENGDLKIVDETNREITIADLGDTLEAVLIEALEPRQNRKRGNSFSGIEYIQSEDPEIQKKRIRLILDELKGKI